MKVLFFGYGQVGFRAVQLLLARGDQIAAVVTHRDDPEENRWFRTPAEAAAAGKIPVLYDDEIKDRDARVAAEIQPDLILSVFYRKLLPRAVIETRKIAALNLHPSLLPSYRGRCPINWVLIHGESHTGVTVHHMVEAADAGDIVARRKIEIAPRETAFSLHGKIERASCWLLNETLPLVARREAPAFPQDESKASSFGARRPEDGKIDWAWPASRIDRLVRAVAPPWPGAFGHVQGRLLHIHAGEPAEPVDRSGPHSAAPGTARRSDKGLFVATGDRWFRIDEAREFDAHDVV